MPGRTQFALVVCGVIALASIATGLDLVLVRGCEVGDGCAGADVAWVIGLPLIVRRTRHLHGRAERLGAALNARAHAAARPLDRTFRPA
jgi:hypothetical protein